MPSTSPDGSARRGSDTAETIETIQRAGQRATDRSQRADLGSLARGGALGVAGAGISAVAGVGLVVLVTRGFSPAEAGIFFAATSVFLLIEAVAKLGTQTGLVYFIARFRVLNQRDRIGPTLAAALTPVIITSLLLGAALFVAAPGLASVTVDGPAGHFVSYLRTIAIFLPFAALCDPLLGATRGFRTQRPTVLIDNIGRPLSQLMLIAVVAASASAAPLGLAWAAPYLLAAVLAWCWLASLGRDTPARGWPPRGLRWLSGEHARSQRSAFWRYTWPQAFVGAAQLALQRLDIILVAALRGPADAAVYTAATRFLVVGQLGGKAISTAVQPQLSEQLALGNRPAARTLYRVGTAWLMLLTWPLYLLCAVFAEQLPRVFGSGYEAGGEVVRVLSLTMLVATGCGMVNMVLTMAGRTSWNLANTVLALTVNVVANLLLIPGLGILGAALAWAAAILTNNLVPLAQVSAGLRLHPFGRATLTAGLLAGGCFGGLPLAMGAIAGDGLAPVIVGVGCGAVTYVAGCWWCRRRLRLTEMRALLRRRRG